MTSTLFEFMDSDIVRSCVDGAIISWRPRHQLDQSWWQAIAPRQCLQNGNTQLEFYGAQPIDC